MLIYGTTVTIGKFDVETLYGDFKVNVFQDLIHKGYILALSHGDIHEKCLKTRIHSSCITSETLGSMDCDCVLQLNGALEQISKTNGILFYLIQEGRGCGYVGKSRACMLVQESEQKGNTPITTFDAYKNLGMKHDYRQYSNIGDICKILQISPEWILMSNNPDKINGLLQNGQKIKRVESLEIPPNPFNYSYLLSKKQTGHLLHKVKTKINPKFSIPEKLLSFEPTQLPGAPRFIFCSSYFLPLQPSAGYILTKTPIESNDVELILENQEKQYLYKSTNSKYESEPFWFKVFVYYDKITHHDFVVLKYATNDSKVPLVRIHSESILDRFPLKTPKYRNKYKKCILEIVKREHGYIFLFHKDGRGSSLGNLCLNLESNSGIKDTRDYSSIITLVKSHLKNQTCDVFKSGQSYQRLKTALEENKVPVNDWISIEE